MRVAEHPATLASGYAAEPDRRPGSGGDASCQRHDQQCRQGEDEKTENSVEFVDQGVGVGERHELTNRTAHGNDAERHAAFLPTATGV